MPKLTNRIDSRAAAIEAFEQMFAPIAQLAIQVGLSMTGLNSILRYAAVKSVAAAQRSNSNRVNISGIAALTGIPRSEIARILRSGKGAKVPHAKMRQPVIHRVLTAWHEEPRFTSSEGIPLDLKLYGRGPTFESLVRAHGGGIPTRALLDELIRAGAVEVIASHKVCARRSSIRDPGAIPQHIKAFGDRTTELMLTMLSASREPEKTNYISTVSGSTPTIAGLTLFKRNLMNISSAFLDSIREELKHEEANDQSFVRVTLFCYVSDSKKDSKNPTIRRRRNFRRKSSRSQIV